MKKLFARLFAFAFLFAVSLSALAQGTAFTYQGRLNFGTNVAHGSFDLTLALFNASSGPGQVGVTLTNTATAVSNGFFTVTLDFGNQFSGANRWLEIGVRTNGNGAFTLLTPRQLLAPAPYSVFAANAGTASSVSGNVSATQISGTIPLARLPVSVVTNGATGVNFSGTFSGNGAGVTNVSVPLSAVNSGGAISWPGIFTPTPMPSIGSGPSVASADVNGDGRIDLITVTAFSSLHVLTNNGSGGFNLSSAPVGPIASLFVTAADVNGDGKSDLISAFGGGGLLIFTNNGSGVFPNYYTAIVGDGAQSVTAADVNNDGKVDLISANTGTNSLTVLTNNGTGVFTVASSPVTSTGPSAPTSVAAADVNGDGKVDLISANQAGQSLTVFTNNGTAGFSSNATLNVGWVPLSVTAADINSDGKADLIGASAATNTLTVFTNNGSGVFGSNATLTVGSQPRVVISVDMNGDSKVDLISANALADTLTVLTNNGSGVFVVASSPVVGSTPYSVVAPDVNGDGRADLVSAGFGSGILTVLLNTPVFSGDGRGLISLNAANLTGSVPSTSLTSVPSGNLTGTVSDARLSANVALRSGGNTFTGNQVITNGSLVINQTNSTALVVTGDSTLTGLRLRQTASSPNLIAGHADNTIDAGIQGSTIAGGGANGQPNLITNAASNAVIAGGKGNAIGGTGFNGSASVIAGGDRNTASGQIASIGGGQFNSANANYSTIPGGANNSVGANGAYSLAAGQRAKANHTGTLVWSDSQAADFASTGDNQFLVRANGGVGINTNNPGPNALAVAGNTHLAGTLRSGNETVGESPNPVGLVVRRVNSTVSTSNLVVAASLAFNSTNQITLVRDGTAGGWRINFPATTSTYTIAFMGMDNVGATRNYYTTVTAPGSAGSLQIYSQSQNVVHFQCTFGDTYNGGQHLTQVTLSRAQGDNYWSGTLISTYNQ